MIFNWRQKEDVPPGEEGVPEGEDLQEKVERDVAGDNELIRQVDRWRYSTGADATAGACRDEEAGEEEGMGGDEEGAMEGIRGTQLALLKF